MAAALAGPSLAAAAATWLPPQMLSENGQEASSSVVAEAPQGTVLSAWGSSDGVHTRIYTSIRPAGGAFGPAVPVSASGALAQAPAVAFDSQGNAIVVWALNGIIQAAVAPLGGSFGPAQDVSLGGEEASSPQVIFDSLGNAIVVWASRAGISPAFTFRVESNVRPAGGSFGSPHELDSESSSGPTHSVNFSSIQLAADGQGDVFAVWSLSSEEMGGAELRSYSIRTALRPASGPFSEKATLASASPFPFMMERVSTPDIAADPQGDALVVWSRQGSTTALLEGKVRPAGGAFEASAENVSGTAEGSNSPQVAFDRNGNAIAVWSGLLSGKAGILAATRPVGGGFSSPQLLSEEGASSTSPVVSFTAKGDALVAWERINEPIRIEAATRPLGGSFGAPVPVSPTAKPGAINEPSLAVDGQGDAVATWRRFDTNYRAEVAGYDGAGPQLQSLSVPGKGTVGSPLAFSVAPLDVWSTVTTAWTFGDGSSANGSSVTHAYGAVGSYPVSVTATDALGNSTSASGMVAVAPAPTPKPPAAVAPTIANVTQSHRIWREGGRRAMFSRKHKPPLGTTFSFSLNEQARVNFAFTRQLTGRKVKGKCVAQTHKNRHRRACKRTVTQGTLAFTGHTGTNKVSFQGRISASKKLPPGRYKLVITATTSGLRSQPKTLTFTIVK